MEEKRCSKCGEVKLSKEFYLDLSRKTNLSSHCKVCIKISSANYREKYPDKVRESKKRCYQNNQAYYYKKSREWIMANRIKVRQYSLKWWRKNPNKWKISYFRKVKYSLPCYLRELLFQQGIPKETITKKLIQLKREELILFRNLKKLKEVYNEPNHPNIERIESKATVPY